METLLSLGRLYPLVVPDILDHPHVLNFPLSTNGFHPPPTQPQTNTPSHPQIHIPVSNTLHLRHPNLSTPVPKPSTPTRKPLTLHPAPSTPITETGSPYSLPANLISLGSSGWQLSAIVKSRTTSSPIRTSGTLRYLHPVRFCYDDNPSAPSNRVSTLQVQHLRQAPSSRAGRHGLLRPGASLALSCKGKLAPPCTPLASGGVDEHIRHQPYIAPVNN